MPCDIHTHGGEGGQDDESIDSLGVHELLLEFAGMLKVLYE